MHLVFGIMLSWNSGYKVRIDASWYVLGKQECSNDCTACPPPTPRETLTAGFSHVLDLRTCHCHFYNLGVNFITSGFTQHLHNQRQSSPELESGISPTPFSIFAVTCVVHSHITTWLSTLRLLPWLFTLVTATVGTRTESLPHPPPPEISQPLMTHVLQCRIIATQAPSERSTCWVLLPFSVIKVVSPLDGTL